MVDLQGKWSLPPEQRVLRPDETPFNLDRVARELTVIMSTSVGDFTPSTDKVVTALDSLQANIALRWCRKILVFDQVPSVQELEILRRSDERRYREDMKGPKWEKMWNDKREVYGDYCQRLRDMKENNHPALFNVELIFLQGFGHLLGTVHRALEAVTTEYIFITQHDLRLAPRFVAADVQNVLDVLQQGVARYVLLNRDVNSGPRTKTYFDMCPEQSWEDTGKASAGIRLTGMAGFSDQAHFAEADWYRREVVHAIPPERQLTCMEHVLHDIWKQDSEWRRTFLYGGPDDGPYVYDLVHGVQVRGLSGQLVGIKAMPERAVPE